MWIQMKDGSGSLKCGKCFKGRIKVIGGTCKVCFTKNIGVLKPLSNVSEEEISMYWHW